MKTNSIVIEAIKKKMIENNKSYSWLANEIDVSKALIGHMLSGKRTMKSERLVSITNALGISLEDLLSKNNEDYTSAISVDMRGKLSSRKAKRLFDSSLFAIEDYMTMKQVD